MSGRGTWVALLSLPLAFVGAGCGADRGQDGTAAAAFAAFAASSAAGPGIAPRVSTEDGVARLSHDSVAFANAPRWSVDSQPIAVIGAGQGDSALDVTSAEFVRVLSDHRIVVLVRGEFDRRVGNVVRGENAILVFAPDGTLLRRFGRASQPAMIFRFPSGLLLMAGDTLLIPDPPERQVHWLHPDAGIVRSRSFERNSGGVVGGGIWLTSHFGLLGDRIVGSGTNRGIGWSTRDEEGRAIQVVATSGLTGNDVAQIATVVGPRPVDVQIVDGQQRRQDFELPRFSQVPRFALWDSLLVTGAGPDYSLDLSTLTGRPVASLAVKRPRLAVTAGVRDTHVARETRRLSRARPRPAPDRQDSGRVAYSLPFADSLPSFGRLFVTRGGTLWVVDETPPGSGRPWSATAFGKGGRLLGRVIGRGDGMPVSFSDERLVVRVEAPEGAARLDVYRLVPP